MKIVAPPNQPTGIPPLSNGMPRVEWCQDRWLGARLSAIVTEDEPIMLLTADSGLELVFERVDKSDVRAGVAVVRARRRSPAPTVEGFEESGGKAI